MVQHTYPQGATTTYFPMAIITSWKCSCGRSAISNFSGNQQHIMSFDSSTYPIMRFSSVQKRVDALLISRTGLPFLGVRIRDLPLLGPKGKDALKA
ncbi:hypothetical protein CI15_27390 [Paraburkholderia monticola]|uniref:Uncharacterized protein n=2 Tax=Paraburkholderia monticola TaxID=1399968 RepID=A0A149PGQ5_9BURK|nr:hypothetical protein CI15_27390 [Paraburkholderia monticola]